MPSFDIVSQVDRQEVKNAVEQTNKEVSNRFDFKGSDARVEEGENLLTVYADDDFKLGQVTDVLRGRLAKRNVDVRCLEPGTIEKISGDKVKRPIQPKVGGAGCEQRLDQLLGHLEVAFHAEVPAERIALVRPMRVLHHARGARWNGEGLAVPVERLEGLQLAQPFARHFVVGDAHLAPAD